METTKSFEELVKDAAAISDKRNKAFVELLDNLTNVYIPELGKILTAYDLGKTFFRLENRPRCDFNMHHDMDGNSYYGLCISYDEEIIDAHLEYQYESETLKWRVCKNAYWYDKNSYRLFRGAAIELAEAIKGRIAELNKIYAQKNECAEKLINEI